MTLDIEGNIGDALPCFPQVVQDDTGNGIEDRRSISVISRLTLTIDFPVPPSTISRMGNTSVGFISVLRSPQWLHPERDQHCRRGRHWQNSTNEICSTDTRFTVTYARR